MQYEAHFTQQVKRHSKQAFLDALNDIRIQIKRAKENATKVYNDVVEQWNASVLRRDKYVSESGRVANEINALDKDLNENVLEITKNCVEKCRTGEFVENLVMTSK